MLYRVDSQLLFVPVPTTVVSFELIDQCLECLCMCLCVHSADDHSKVFHSAHVQLFHSDLRSHHSSQAPFLLMYLQQKSP